jgi:hypothetical protein
MERIEGRPLVELGDADANVLAEACGWWRAFTRVRRSLGSGVT